MKRKCGFCGIIFSFKTKDLKLSKNQKRIIEYTKYIINCPFCFTPKEIFLNQTPHKIFNNPILLIKDIPKEKIISLDILQKSLYKDGLTKTSNLIRNFSEKYTKLMISNKRKSRIEMISTYKNEKDILDNILNKSVVKQLVESTSNKNNTVYSILLYILSIILAISILIITII